MSSNDRIAGVKPDSMASAKPSNQGYQTHRPARSPRISQMSSFWQDRLTLRGKQGVYMSGQMRFEMAHDRWSQRCPGELRQAVLRVPHTYPSQTDALEGSSMRQLFRLSYDRLGSLTYVIRDHEAFSQFAFEMFAFGETT
jgi:hypothetical protein